MNLRAVFFAFSILIHGLSASAFSPVNGHWWNPAESGSGYNIDISNGVMVITVYSYKTNGDSEWYLAAGPMSQDQRQFTGTLDKYRNGQCISCAYSGRPGLVGNDGSISVNFLSETSATLTLPGGRHTNIQPFFPPANAAPLDGTYRLKRGTVDYLGGSLLDTDSGNLIASGTLVISGNRFTQSLRVTVNGGAVEITQTFLFTDYGAYLAGTFNGQPLRVTTLSRAPILAILSNNPAIGSSPPYAEVDQWERVTSATSGLSATRDFTPESNLSSAPLAGAIGMLVTQNSPR